MNNTTKIRQLLKEIKTSAGKSQRDVFYYLKAEQALALLPCETCNGTKEIPQEASNCSCVYCSNGLDGCQIKIPCPDCRKDPK